MTLFLGLLSAAAVVAAAVIAARETRKSRDATAKAAAASRAAAEQSRKAKELIDAQHVRVDELQVAREAYETANRITGGLLAGLTREVERLNVEVSGLRSSNRSLEQQVAALVDVLHEHDIPIPHFGT